MHRYLTYAGVFVTLVLIQIFLIDNISLGIYFHPLIYIAFLIVLPLDTKPVWVVLLAALLGLTIDTMTGLGGLNVIAATATGFMRGTLLGITSGHSTSTDDSIPSLNRLTDKNYTLKARASVKQCTVCAFIIFKSAFIIRMKTAS